MRRIDAPKRYMNGGGAYANRQYKDVEAVRLVNDSDYVKLLAVARALEKNLNAKSFNFVEVNGAMTALNAKPKVKK